MGTAFVPRTTPGPTVVYGRRAAVRDRVFTTALTLTWLTGGFLTLYKLGVAGWSNDELIYRNAGRAYLTGNFSPNPEHPPLVKYILGLVQLVAGSGATAVRLPAAICGLLTGLFLFLIARRMAGRWAGLAVLAVWSLTPHPFGALRVERMALLEPFMMLFVVAAVWAGQRWAADGSWRWAATAGVLCGLATACKAPGVVALVLVVVLGLAAGLRGQRTVEQVSGMIVIAAGVFLAMYLPFGTDMGHTLATMWTYQHAHAENGHPVVIAGIVYAHPPWWAALWLFWSTGRTGAVAYLTLLALVPALLPRRVAVPVLVFVGSWLLFFTEVSTFLLRHYLYALSPALALAAGLVLHRLFSGGRSGMLAVGVITAAMLAAGSAATVRAVVDVQPRPSASPSLYQRAAGLVTAADLGRARVAVLGARSLMAAYLPLATIDTTIAGIDPRRDVVVVDRTFMRGHYRGWHLEQIRRRLAARRMVERSVGGGLRVFVPPSAARRLLAGGARGS